MRTVLIVAIVMLFFIAGSAVAYKIFVIDNPSRALAYRRGAGWSEPIAYPGSGGCPGGGCAVSAGATSGIGSCCGSDAPGATAADLEKVRQLAVSYYTRKYNDTEVTCEVRDFGCHMEAYIIKGGDVIKRLTVSGGRIYEI